MSPVWKGIVGQGYSPAGFIQYVNMLRFGVWRPSLIVLHNTGVPTLEEWKRTPGSAHMKALERYYRDEQGWSAGPHLFVDDTVIYVFTPLTVPGVHSPSWNGISWGVELVGDYNREPMNHNVFQNGASALATLFDAVGLDPDGLKIHREDPKTTHTGCPGKNLIKADMIALVKEKLAIRHAGEHKPDRACPPIPS